MINGNENKHFEKKILNINRNLEIFYSSYKPVNLVQLKNRKFFAIAGIGNPENFFQLIEENNLYIKKKFTFPDHYKFSKIEIQNIIDEAENNNCQLLMTEKDYFKIDQFKLKNINYLKVDLQIDKIDKLIFKVKRYMIRIINYFFQSIFIYSFFIIGRVLGLKISRKLFSFFFSIVGPIFKSEKIIKKNLEIFSKKAVNIDREKIISDMWKNYGMTFIEYVFLDYFQKNKSDVIVEDNSNLSKVLTDNKPVIFVSGHFAHFELMSMEITKKKNTISNYLQTFK